MNAAIAAAPAGSTILVNSGTYAEAVALNKAVTLQLQQGASTFASITGSVTGAAILLNGVNLTVGDATSGTLTAALTGSGSITKQGAGTLTIAGPASYTGITTVNAGALRAGSTSALSPFSDVTVAASATLQLGGFSNSVGSLAGTGFVENSGFVNATLTVGQDNASTSFAGTIRDGSGGFTNLSLVKTGGGTFALTGPNSYTGTTTISLGTVVVGDGTTNGTLGSFGAVTNNSVLQFNRSDSVNVFNTISGTGTLIMNGTGTVNIQTPYQFGGGTTVSTGTLIANLNSGSLNTGPPIFVAATGTLAVQRTLPSSGTGITLRQSDQRLRQRRPRLRPQPTTRPGNEQHFLLRHADAVADRRHHLPTRKCPARTRSARRRSLSTTTPSSGRPEPIKPSRTR